MRASRSGSLEPSLRKVINALRSTRTPHMVIGALALTAWAQPRATMDFDIMVAENSLSERLVCSLSESGFDIDTNGAQYNPMIRHSEK